jgi:hypothetical protein
MKTFIIAVALVSLIATPVFAQTNRQTTQNTRAQVHQLHSSNWRNDVYVNGRYVGSDPDSSIRNQLLNDPSQGGNDSGGAGE